jgi:hypothetical protein
MKKSVKVETAAVVTINVKHGSEYGKRFTARYRYDAKKKP